MAKAKSKPTADETDEFAPAGDLTAHDADETGDVERAEIDPRDAEIERLKAELAAAKAAQGPTYAGGKKYTVALKDGPKAVVKCEPGEHPWDAYRRVTGVINSVNPPVITEAHDAAECGIVA